LLKADHLRFLSILQTAKTATPVPVVVIASDQTETSSGALQKKLSLKELRLANEDLIKDFFSCSKDDGAPLVPAIDSVALVG
jgi:prolyl-tRNA synthetase